MNSQAFIEILKKHDEIKVIEAKTDIYLEIAHASYVEMKKENPKALLFTNPIDKKRGIEFQVPVLVNIFGSQKKM